MSARNEITSALPKLQKLAPSGYFLAFHIRFAAPLMQFTSYSKEWSDYYAMNGFALRDPVIAWGFSTTGACRWSVLPVPDPFGILREAAMHGLRYGVTISHGEMTSRTIASFVHPDREFTDAEVDTISTMIRRLHDLLKPPESLTKAQIEALRCIAEGDRYAAAAAKLGISESAFKARLISARERLNARTTAEALQRAKEYRLL